MKKLTSNPSLVTIHHFKNLLESEGIPCEIRNAVLNSIFGEIPFQDTWPQLWVMNDLDYDRAKQLVEGDLLDESPAGPWRCSGCGEENEGQFAVCWNCGEKAV